MSPFIGGFWIFSSIFIGVVIYLLTNVVPLPNRVGRLVAILLGSTLPFIILYFTNATKSATDGWGLYTIPLSVGGAYLGFELLINPKKFSLVILSWQLFIGIIALALYLANMDLNDYAFTYYPAQHLMYGLDYSTTLNKLHQAYESEITATILYCLTTTLLITFPLSTSFNKFKTLL